MPLSAKRAGKFAERLFVGIHEQEARALLVGHSGDCGADAAGSTRDDDRSFFQFVHFRPFPDSALRIRVSDARIGALRYAISLRSCRTPLRASMWGMCPTLLKRWTATVPGK